MELWSWWGRELCIIVTKHSDMTLNLSWRLKRTIRDPASTSLSVLGCVVSSLHHVCIDIRGGEGEKFVKLASSWLKRHDRPPPGLVPLQLQVSIWATVTGRGPGRKCRRSEHPALELTHRPLPEKGGTKTRFAGYQAESYWTSE